MQSMGVSGVAPGRFGVGEGCEGGPVEEGGSGGADDGVGGGGVPFHGGDVAQVGIGFSGGAGGCEDVGKHGRVNFKFLISNFDEEEKTVGAGFAH